MISRSETRTGGPNEQCPQPHQLPGGPQGQRAPRPSPTRGGVTSVPSMAGKSLLGRGCQETKKSPINMTAPSLDRTFTCGVPKAGEREARPRQGGRPPPQASPGQGAAERLRKTMQEGRGNAQAGQGSTSSQDRSQAAENDRGPQRTRRPAGHNGPPLLTLEPEAGAFTSPTSSFPSPECYNPGPATA